MVTQDKFFNYFDSIGVKESAPWRPWTTDGKRRMGGYVVSYPGNFHYLTIRGSGHMVPVSCVVFLNRASSRSEEWWPRNGLTAQRVATHRRSTSLRRPSPSFARSSLIRPSRATCRHLAGSSSARRGRRSAAAGASWTCSSCGSMGACSVDAKQSMECQFDLGTHPRDSIRSYIVLHPKQCNKICTNSWRRALPMALAAFLRC
eukprot:SAG11_NODE_2489_length_3295_cov_2.382666_1_plen_203_part_00